MVLPTSVAQQILQLNLQLDNSYIKDPAAAARTKILKWLYQKTGVELPRQAWRGESFILTNDQLRQEAEVVMTDGVWGLRFKHPDDEGREWRTEVFLSKEDDKAFLKTKLVTLYPVGTKPAFYTVPRFISVIADDIGLIDAKTSLYQNEGVIYKDNVKELYDVIMDRDRTLPVIVISERDLEGAISPREAAEKLFGIAHVFRLTGSGSWAFSEMMPKDFSVFHGAVRTYRPGFDLRKDDRSRHPIAFFETIQKWRGGPEGYLNYLRFQSILESAGRSNTGIPSFTHIKTDLLEKGRSQTSTVDAEEIDTLKALVASLKEEVNEAMQLGQDECNKIREDYGRQLVDVIKERDSVTRERDALKAKVFHLTVENERLSNGDVFKAAAAEVTMRIPETLQRKDLEPWIQEYFDGKLHLTSKAYGAAADSEYKDVAMVYRVLQLLGQEYWNMKYGDNEGGKARKIFDERSKELRVSVGKTFTGDKPVVNQEAYTTVADDGKTYLLDLHLQRGSSRKPEKCLRVYFKDDDAKRRLIIGSLPAHLRNTLT